MKHHHGTDLLATNALKVKPLLSDSYILCLVLGSEELFLPSKLNSDCLQSLTIVWVEMMIGIRTCTGIIPPAVE